MGFNHIIEKLQLLLVKNYKDSESFSQKHDIDNILKTERTTHNLTLLDILAD